MTNFPEIDSAARGKTDCAPKYRGEMIPLDCPECSGSGEHVLGHPSGDPQRETSVPCPDCLGKGIASCDGGCCSRPAVSLAWTRNSNTSREAVPTMLCGLCLREWVEAGQVVGILDGEGADVLRADLVTVALIAAVAR